MKGEPNSMVGDTILRKIIGSDFFSSITRTYLGTPILSNRGILFLLLGLDNSRPQGSHGFIPILQLGSFILAGDHHTGGDMGNSNSRIGRIDTLPPSAGRTKGIKHKELYCRFRSSNRLVFYVGFHDRAQRHPYPLSERCF